MSHIDFVIELTLFIEDKSAVNSNGYIHLGGNIRNIYILLLLTLGLGQGQLHHFVEIDQPQLRERGPCISEEQRQTIQYEVKKMSRFVVKAH